MTDAVKIQLVMMVGVVVSALASPISAVMLAVLNRQQKRTASEQAVKVAEVKTVAEVAAHAAQEVKDTLKETTAAQQLIAADHGKAIADVAVDTRATRKSVDGAMSALLGKLAISERRWANHSKLPVDQAVAALAEKACRDHQASEREIADGGTPPTDND